GQVFLEGRMFPFETQSLFLGQLLETPVGPHGFDIFQSLDRLLDGLEISQEPAQPAVIHKILPAPLRLFFDCVLSLTLRANEQECPPIERLLCYELYSLFEQPLGLLQIDDVNAISLAEDILLHLRVPSPDLVPEMHTSLKQFLHRYCSQCSSLTSFGFCTRRPAPRKTLPPSEDRPQRDNQSREPAM